MSTQPLAFTGISKFSTDLQTILSRAVQIASLPIKSLQNDQMQLLTKKQLLTNLNGSVASLADSLAALGQLGQNKALSATSSNAAKVTANSVVATAPATYTISEITSVARSASASTAGFATADETPVSATGALKLTVAGVEHPITLAVGQNSLEGLRDGINALGAGVTANILTTGTGPTPYALSITATANGEKPILLVDDPEGPATNLIAASDDGADTKFKINGVAVTKSSTLVNDVVPGVSFSIAGTTGVGETVTLTLATDRTRLSAALESFVSSYNAAAAQADAQVGASAGLLTGDFIVRELQADLRQLAGYQGSGGIASLSDLGIEFASDGTASFEAATFAALSDTQIQDAFTYLGSETTGFGALADKFQEISDPVIGLIKLQQDQYDTTDRSLTSQISVLTERVSAMQTSLSARLQAADALLAQLDSQQTLLDATIQGLNLTLYGKNDR